ncbi:MAG TPA: NADH-quinone oxidoreductase subunit C [Acidobacteriaceae bacterium]
MNLETIKAEIEANVPGCSLQLVTNASPCAQHSLLLDAEHAVAVATYLRDAAGLRFDFCSNVTGIDWPQREISEKVKVKKLVDGVETEVDEVQKRVAFGYLEAVYHLYSMELKHGPVTLRMRTRDRETQVHLPSLMHVWRSADLQEREIFDLYGIIFDGHHDLRRLLMWEGFVDHPMRRDYVEPDDFEYEPTAHGDVLTRAQQHAAETGGQ